MEKFKVKLWQVILLDSIGFLSYFIPGVGEYIDVLWAPLSAFLFYKMYGGKMGRVGAAIEFVEELLPFVDFIPTFTIAWIIRKFSKGSKS